MELQEAWLVRGYFKVKSESGESFTQKVRERLAPALGLDPKALHLASYPVGPAWRYWLWWRERDEDYVEAQFFAGLALEYPILSIGVSVEKGLERQSADESPTDLQGIAPHPKSEKGWMDRERWDWHRLVDRRRTIVLDEVPAVCERIQRPVLVKLHKKDLEDRTSENWNRTFVHLQGSWFERHKGSIEPEEICSHIEGLDRQKDHWVDALFCCELGPRDVDGMTTDQFAEILVSFAPLRARIREDPDSAPDLF